MDLYSALVSIHGKAKVWSWNNQECLDAASDLLDGVGESCVDSLEEND